MGLTSSSLSASSRGAVLHAARPSQLAQPSVRLVSFVAGGRGSASSNAESRFSAEAQQLAALSRHRGARERPLGLCGGFGKADSASLSEGSENAAASAGFWLGGEGCLASQHMPWRGALPLGCTDGSAQSWALLQQVRHSKHPLKLKSREIRHPHVVCKSRRASAGCCGRVYGQLRTCVQVGFALVFEAPEHLPPPRYTEARLEGLQKFVPVNFYSELVSRILSLANADCRLCEKGAGVFAPCKSLQRADSAREGVFTGLDGCLSFNGKWKSWRRRKYNTKQHSTHTHASQVKGVNYLSR